MIDFILIVFMCAVLWFGFWLGKTYGTVAKVAEAAKAQVKSWFE